MGKLSHVDDANRPTMVDVGDKTATDRTATARSIVRLPAQVVAALVGEEIETKKGPVFATAIIAGVMAAKKTPSERRWVRNSLSSTRSAIID